MGIVVVLMVMIIVASSTGSTAQHFSVQAVNSTTVGTEFSFTKLLTITTTTTYYLNVYQNSTSELTMAAGSSGAYNSMRAMRIL